MVRWGVLELSLFGYKVGLETSQGGALSEKRIPANTMPSNIGLILCSCFRDDTTSLIGDRRWYYVVCLRRLAFGCHTHPHPLAAVIQETRAALRYVHVKGR